MTEHRFSYSGFYRQSNYYQQDSPYSFGYSPRNNSLSYYGNCGLPQKEPSQSHALSPYSTTPRHIFQDPNIAAVGRSSNDIPSSSSFYPDPMFNNMPECHSHSSEGYVPLTHHRRDGKSWNSGMQHATSSFSAASSRSSNNKRVIDPPDGFIYQVQFKRAHRNFVLSPSAPRDILPGDFVKVEADRGEDMGIVLAKCPAELFEEVVPTAGYRGRGFSSGHGERKYLYRLATAEERAALAQKVKDEEKALEIIREKVLERGLPMNVLDAEYQLDRHKLTFYFEAERRIDFRELVSELFSHYKTRIWMQQVDTTSLSLHDAGLELAKATGFLPEREDNISVRSSISLGQEDMLCCGSISDSLDTDNQLEQLSVDTVSWSGNNNNGYEALQNRSPLWSQLHDFWNNH